MVISYGITRFHTANGFAETKKKVLICIINNQTHF
ncbi:hypothetical protein SAMN04515674_102463 [Pseudarcicella hirudinis]|uniref:Uncharacterized protein n=1 Tax=Pseudarcicella hirudinis TaxID=1079859 RepID=A0A1I5PHR3_9BACT|nr:hypothetical protein SAMN04515674_102463 [Pseudarcicella hirudinis]